LQGELPLEGIEARPQGHSLSLSAFRAEGQRPYLPRYLFGYYSGPSNRLEEHFAAHQKLFYDALIRGVEKPLRPLLYARLIHSQFVLLAFFIDRDDANNAIRDFLREQLRIEGLDSVLFVMREPSWTSKEGDARFWYARGTVQKFLDKLYSLALAPLRFEQRVELHFRKNINKEHLYLYLPDQQTLRDLASIYDSQQDFFKALESTYISDLISEVRIRVKIRNMDGSLTFREMSEGEQQLLMVLGLLRFTKEDESLFLLDEPDTHLNPNWSIYYLKYINDIVGDQQTSQVIMSTHNPLTLAGLTSRQVSIIYRDEETGQIRSEPAQNDPKGMGVGGILTSDIFGLRSTLDPATLQLLDEKRSLSIKTPEEMTSRDRERLADLNDELENLGFNKTSSDPLYEPFVDAMTEVEQQEGMQVPVLSREQQAERKELALKVLQKVKQKKNSR